MAVHSDNPLLIGVDGGATEVKACAIERDTHGLVAGPQRAAFRCEIVAGFAPVPLAEQMSARDAGRVVPGALEREQAERWIDACAQSIVSVAASAQRSRVRVGICMPGLKSRDRRGIDVTKNGPRAPDFLDRLEQRIASAGFVLDAPVAGLASDGDACGHGEEAGAGGSLRDVVNAYFVGGGTGLCECFKLDGRVAGLDELAGRVEKAWSMTSSMGRSYEEHVSVRGINARFVELGGDASSKPESGWARGAPAAVLALSECVTMLDELLRKRLDALQRAGLPRPERIVVGQRLGLLLSMPELAALRSAAEHACPIAMCVSTLRSAPAIGAAHMALEAGRASGAVNAV